MVQPWRIRAATRLSTSVTTCTCVSSGYSELPLTPPRVWPNRLAPAMGIPPAPGTQARGVPPPNGITFTMPDALSTSSGTPDQQDPFAGPCDRVHAGPELVAGIHAARDAGAGL